MGGRDRCSDFVVKEFDLELELSLIGGVVIVCRSLFLISKMRIMAS